MPNPAKYITMLLLLLCSLQSNAQRMIPWYEPDFDSVYRQCFFVYGERFYFPHYYHFWSKTARKHRLKSIVTNSEYTGSMPYRGVRIAKYDTAGYLEALDWYVYNVSKGHNDTFIISRQQLSHEVNIDGIKVVAHHRDRHHGDTSSHKYVFHFNNDHRLESEDVSQSSTYHYDTLGRLLTIEGHVKNNNNRSVDSFFYSSFVREVDSTDSFMYRRMKGIWPENILSFILDSSNGKNRYRMIWESATRIGIHIYPSIREYEVLTDENLHFVKRVRLKDSGEEKAGFAQAEHGKMVTYSHYSFLGKGFEYLIARRIEDKWKVLEYILGNQKQYDLPVTELPEVRRFSDRVDQIKYTFHLF